MAADINILIVDDSPVAREILGELLEPEGYALHFAETGEAGLAVVDAVQPDIILLDVVMPGISGFEVCRKLREKPGLAEVPILLITTLDDRESKLQGLNAGADDFLNKPFDSSELLARLKTISRLNRYRKLNEERARFEWVAREAGDGYLMLDAAENVVYANPRALAYLGLAEDTALPVGPFLELVRDRFRPEPAAAWLAWPAPTVRPSGPARSSEDEPPVPLYLVMPETETSPSLWLQVDVLDQSESLGARLVRLKDVTAQMATQTDMWSFQSMITHKLRTPLSGILVGMEILASDAASMAVEDIAELCQLGMENALRLNEEIEDITGYLEAPRLAAEGEGAAVDDLARAVRAQATELGLEAVSFESSLPKASRFTLTSRAMEQILWECMDNAVKFHPGHEPEINVSLTPKGEDQALVGVADNGLTLSPQQLERAFTPYYQGEKHLTFEVAGMGLGLSKVAALVWDIGGRCALKNRDDGPGVVVEITLPLAAATGD